MNYCHPSNHPVSLSPCHPVTLSPCHLVTLSPCHLVTLSPRSEVRRLPLQILPPSNRPHKLPIPHRNLPTHRHHRRPPFDLPPLKRIVVQFLHLRHRRKLPAIIRIIDHQIRIAPHRNRPLPRKQSKQLRRIRARRRHERLKIHPPRLHP